MKPNNFQGMSRGKTKQPKGHSKGLVGGGGDNRKTEVLS